MLAVNTVCVNIRGEGIVYSIDSDPTFLHFRHILLSPPDEEPEEDLSVEQLEEKAKAGDARAQTRVS